MLVAAHSKLERHLQYALNLWAVIDVGVEGFLIILILLSEVHSTRQLTYDNEISTLDKLLFQWALMQQAIECGNRANVGKEAKFFAHSKQAWANFQCWIVVETWVTYSGEQHGIGIHTNFESLFRERIATCIYGMSSAESLRVSKLMAKLLCHDIQYLNGLWHNLRTNTIAR